MSYFLLFFIILCPVFSCFLLSFLLFVFVSIFLSYPTLPYLNLPYPITSHPNLFYSIGGFYHLQSTCTHLYLSVSSRIFDFQSVQVFAELFKTLKEKSEPLGTSFFSNLCLCLQLVIKFIRFMTDIPINLDPGNLSSIIPCIIPSHIMLYNIYILSYHIVSYHTKSYHAIKCYHILYQVISCCTILCCMVSYHTTLHHIIK